MIYQQVIDLLTETKDRITMILIGKDHEHHRLKAESDLQRLITYLSLLTNTMATNGQPETPVLGPAKTIAGKPIQVMKQHVSREELEPNEEKVQVLRGKVEKAYNTFLKTESIRILKDYEENVIRGVAKKAKMKVTREDPETITLEFVEEIKKNIIEMEHRNQVNDQKKQDAEKKFEGIEEKADSKAPEKENQEIEVKAGDGDQGQNQQQPDLHNPNDPEIQQGTQADVNDKGAAAAKDLPSESDIRKETTSTPNVAKTNTTEPPKKNNKPNP